MQIKILNKNLQTPNDYSSAKTFDIVEGSVIKKCKNETLDSATIIVSQLYSKLEIEPLDKVLLIDENGIIPNTYFVVDDYVETQINFKIPTYQYNITLCSETKRLETIMLPNLKITQVWGNPRSVGYYLRQYLSEYGRKVRIQIGGVASTNQWTSLWTFDNSVLTKYDAIQCPEMQWNQPTLREVLNDLMMVADCIPVIRDNVIYAMDLTEVGNDKTNSPTINYVQRSQSSADYISELQIELQNVTNPRKTGIVNYVTKSEYIPFTANEPLITSDNILLKTTYPIYKIKSLKMCYFPQMRYYQNKDSSGTANVYRDCFFVEQDLTNIVVDGVSENIVLEKKEFDTKEIIYRLSLFSSVALKDYYKYQNTCLYYTRGSNEIHNWHKLTDQVIFEDIYLLDELKKKVADNLKALVLRNAPNVDTSRLSEASVEEVGKYYDTFFKIEYETLDGAKALISKGIAPSNERIVQDNQTNSYVDSDNMGILEYMKANRLGNQQLMINARCVKNDTLIQLSDIYEDSIIYQIEYQVYKNHIEVNALATKDYILRNYFTGVKAKIRSWKIADGSEALQRHDLIKYYFEFSYKIKDEIDINLEHYNVDITYLLKTFSEIQNKPIIYGALKTYSGNNSYPSNTNLSQYYQIECISRIIGNSITFSFGLSDNYYVDKYINLTKDNLEWQTSGLGSYVGIKTNALTNGGIPTQYYSYADTNGEFDKGELYLLDGLNFDNGEIDNPYLGDEINRSGDYGLTFVANQFKKPLINENAFTTDNLRLKIPFNFHKDNNEIFKLTTQFEFCSDTTEIVFTKNFVNHQQAISNESSRYVMSIYLGNTSEFNFRNLDTTNITKLNTGYFIYKKVSERTLLLGMYDNALLGNTPEEAIALLQQSLLNKVIYIGNEQNNILLAFKPIKYITEKVETTTETKYRAITIIYLNMLLSRNYNIYDGSKNIIVDKL